MIDKEFIREFETFLKQKYNFESREISLLLPHLRLKTFQKREVVQKAGTYANEVFFILKGGLRTFYMDSHGKEFSLIFSFPQSFVSCPDTLLSPQISQYSIDALENVVVISINKSSFTALMSKSAAFQKMGLHFLETCTKDLLEANLLIRQGDATDFYQKIREENENYTKVPLKYLSSYLGIHQNSLSRIRGMNKKKIQSN